MGKPSKLARENIIYQATEFTPVWGREYVRAAFAGDTEAASSLVFALHDCQRARMAKFMYQYRVPPPAFREVLAGALTQTHHYSAVLKESGGRRQLVRWCRYADYQIPTGPDDITIFRGVMNVAWVAALAGLVLVQKLLPPGRMLNRVSGLALLSVGLVLLARAG